MTLIEFLRARLDEEEQEAREALDVVAPLLEFAPTYGLAAFYAGGSSSFPARHWSWDPDRVLAEIAAKRSILTQWERWEDDAQTSRNPTYQKVAEVSAAALWPVVKLMAQGYRDRTDQSSIGTNLTGGHVTSDTAT